jgi:hypothetical protein
MTTNIEYKQVHSQTTTSLARTILIMFLLTFILARGVRLILRYKLRKMTANEECPELLPAIA